MSVNPIRPVLKAVPDLSTEDPDDWHVPDVNALPDAPVRPKVEDEPEGPPRVPVNGDVAKVDRVARFLARDASDLRPVLPEWLKRKEDRSSARKWAGQYTAHRVKYHGVRAPLYAGKVAVYAPVGAARATARVGKFVAHGESHKLRMEAADKADPKAYLLLAKERNHRVKLRLITVGLAAFVLLVTLLLAWWLAPSWVMPALAGGAVLGLARLGRPKDRPILGRAVQGFEAPRLTDAMVVAALIAIGVRDESAKGGTGITFPAPITRDGAGWRADVDLPPGVTVGDVMDKRSRLASSLRRPLGCVWPESSPDVHEGRLVLWVADVDPAKAGHVKWALAAGKRHDIFDGIPFGVDPRGRPVKVPVIQHNFLIGSQPGQGKTGTVRVLSCGAALDPSVELWLHELKGSGDLDALERISHRFTSGIDDASVQYAADSLKLLRREVERRTVALKKLPRELCPDKRVTRDIADRRELGLWPILCVVDECQNLFAHSKFGAQAAEDAIFIIKIGRAFGVVLVLATQRPDKESLPTGVSGNVSIRFCLRVAGQIETDMIMGTSSYKNGVRPTLFRPEVDAGTGYLGGVRTDPFVVRVAYLDGHSTERIANRAHLLRSAAGTITGHAAGEEPDSQDADRVMVDVLRVWTPGEDAMWSETLAERLADLDPDRYQNADATWLGAELRRRGITPKDRHRKVAGKGQTKKGPARQDIEDALGMASADA